MNVKNYTFQSLLKKYTSASFWLIAATILALLCANSPLKDWYFGLCGKTISLSFGDFNFFSHNGHPFTLVELINDFLMAIFFLSVGFFLHSLTMSPVVLTLLLRCSVMHF